MSVVNEVLAANASYVTDFGAKADLAMPPARGFAILTCMDARLDPAKYAGLAEGDDTSSATPGAAPATTPSAPWKTCSAFVTTRWCRGGSLSTVTFSTWPLEHCTR